MFDLLLLCSSFYFLRPLSLPLSPSFSYALSWAVPEWVGNDTYYTNDNINYHMSWLKCARDEHPDVGNIDYIGAWNERAWGNPDWIISFRHAMDMEGFQNTKIIIPDGSFDEKILQDIDVDVSGKFANALEGGGIGLHYPCNQPHPEVQQKYHLKYWSSEDFSTEADWDGAGCWGRILNQNGEFFFNFLSPSILKFSSSHLSFFVLFLRSSLTHTHTHIRTHTHTHLIHPNTQWSA